MLQKELYENILSIKRKHQKYMFESVDRIGRGAAGQVFLGTLREEFNHKEPLIVKEHKRNKYSNNEIEALRYLRTKMLEGVLRENYIFMYTFYDDCNKRFIILEKLDITLQDYFTKSTLSTQQFLRIFWKIAQTVAELEGIQMNHGDLWSENIMLKFTDENYEKIPLKDRNFIIKFIDFDAAYKRDANIRSPAPGGSDTPRTSFLLGYDLTRFFDALLFSHRDYVKKRSVHLRRKYGKRVKIEEIELDESDMEFDEDNIIYPPEVVKFMEDLEMNDMETLEDNEKMSGKYIMGKIERCAEELGVGLEN